MKKYVHYSIKYVIYKLKSDCTKFNLIKSNILRIDISDVNLSSLSYSLLLNYGCQRESNIRGK